jgi:hypothetical protein
MPKRSWTTTDRLSHSQACRHKKRLTLAQKMKIIALAEGDHVSQARLAELFQKVCTRARPFPSNGII